MVNSELPTTNEAMSPIITSSDLGWDTITVAEFKQPAGNSSFTPDAKHTLALCLADKPYRIYQAIGDRNYSGMYSRGDISIAPAKLPCSYQVYGDDHYLEIKIPTPFLQQIAIEVMNNDRDLSQLDLRIEFRDRNCPIEQLAMMLRNELYQGNDGMGKLYIDSLANALAVNLLRDYGMSTPPVAIYEGGLNDRLLIKAIEYITENIAESIKLEDLANYVGISKFHFSRLFKKSMGVSPHQYVMQERIKQAQQLLTQTNRSILEIAIDCGFNSHAHLSKYFRQITGMTPKNFRQN